MVKQPRSGRTQTYATPRDENPISHATGQIGLSEDAHPTGAQQDWISRIFPDACEKQRYMNTLRRLSMKPVSAWRLADRARLTHRMREIRAALRQDPRFVRVEKRGPERYLLRAAYRHVWTLQEALA